MCATAVEPTRRWWFALCLAGPIALQLVSANDWPHFPSPNERSRAYQAVAVASRGTLSIDAELARFGAMEDVAHVGDRHFPNKAPGLLPLLVPVALFARLAAPSDPEAQLRATLVAGRALAASLPYVLSVVLLAHLLVPRWPRGGPVAVAAWAVASPALPASLLLFAHALTALLLLVGFTLLFTGGLSHRRAALAGVALAWAVCCEYQLAVAAAALVVVALPRLRFRGVGALIAGGAGPALLLALYNTACFGSPLSLSSAHEASPSFAALAHQGLLGISWPSLGGLAGLLASPDRGLLVYMPVLLAGSLGIGAASRALGRRAAVACAAAPLLLVIVMSGYANWHGGWFPGPRYILATVPLLLIPAAAGAERLLGSPLGRAAVAGALLWGALSVWPITASFPFPPNGEPFPSLTLAPSLLADGVLMPSWLPKPAALLLWLAAAAFALLAVVFVGRGRALESCGAVVAVAALGFAAAQAPQPPAFSAALARAVTHDVYAGAAPGRLEALRARCGDAAERRAVDAWIERREGGRSGPQHRGN